MFLCNSFAHFFRSFSFFFYSVVHGFVIPTGCPHKVGFIAFFCCKLLTKAVNLTCSVDHSGKAPASANKVSDFISHNAIQATICLKVVSLKVGNFILILSFQFCKILIISVVVGVCAVLSDSPGTTGASLAGTFGTRLFGAC